MAIQLERGCNDTHISAWDVDAQGKATWVGSCNVWYCELQGLQFGINVRPEYQRKGIGKALILDAMAMRPDCMQAYTMPWNSACRGLFHSLGFDECVYYLYNDRDDYLIRMVRP